MYYIFWNQYEKTEHYADDDPKVIVTINNRKRSDIVGADINKKKLFFKVLT